MEIYRRHQFGRLLALLFLVGALLAASTALMPDMERAGSNTFLALAILVACLIFTFMRIRVTDSELEIRFGTGFPKKRVDLETIVKVRRTRIPWYAVGIKRIRHGWAWSVSPGPALELTLVDGKVVRIGTDDPQTLIQALEKGVRKKLSPSETER